jgi:hypothetical protein
VIGQQFLHKPEASKAVAGPEPSLFCDALQILLKPSRSLLPSRSHLASSRIHFAHTQLSTLTRLYNRPQTRTQKPQSWHQESGVRHVHCAPKTAAHANPTDDSKLTTAQQMTRIRIALPLPLRSASPLPAAASSTMKRTIAMCVNPPCPAIHNLRPTKHKESHTNVHHRS